MAVYSKSQQAFIIKWGDAVSGWGFGRSVGRIHAALLLSDEPMSADDICASLGVARSNVSTSLKELMAAGLVETASVIGQRKERYRALENAEDTTAAVANLIRARSIAPMATVLDETGLKGRASDRLSGLANIAIAALPDEKAETGKESGAKPKKKKKKKNKD